LRLHHSEGIPFVRIRMYGKNNDYSEPSNIIIGYNNQRGKITNDIRRIIRNTLLFVIICLLLKKFASNGLPSWYSMRSSPLNVTSIENGGTGIIFDESLTDFDDYNVVNVQRLAVFITICLAFMVPFFF